MFTEIISGVFSVDHRVVEGKNLCFRRNSVLATKTKTG